MKATIEKRQLQAPSFSGTRTGRADPGLGPGTEKLSASHTGYLPERYTIKTNGNERVLICLEAPNLNVHVENGMAFSASVAKKSPPGTIFLDGVAQCEPFMDHERQIYNLDHHEGCVRAFTMSSCEQALVMYLKGLDLQSREWNIFANEPDLDTLLAIWVILNHVRIAHLDTNQRRLLFALIRYEGTIDALGLELKELSALPSELMRKIHRVIDRLRADELALKKENNWTKTDYLAYTNTILHKIDLIFYKPSDFTDYLGLEELARIDLTEKRIAAVVEADMGIYEIEPHLNKLYGNQLGIVFLKKGPDCYTVRKMDLFMPTSLDCIYDQLNFMDAAVRFRTFANKWGGAADIGGSPRDTGTRLTPFEIVYACRKAVRKPNWLKKIYRFAITAVMAAVIVLCAHIVSLIWNPAHWLGQASRYPFVNQPMFGFLTVILAASGISLTFIARNRPWQYGWSLPTGKTWWLLFPAALLCGISGGVWLPTSPDPKWATISLLGIVGMPLTCEILFRSLIHGLQAQSAPIQRIDTPWFLSWPTIGNTLLYVAFWIALIWRSRPAGAESSPGIFIMSVCGATLLSLTASMIRERSQSLWPAVLFHMLAAASAFVYQGLV